MYTNGKNETEVKHKTREITGQKTRSSTGCIKRGNADNVERKIWSIYVGELFHYERGKPAIKKNMGRPETLKSVVKLALVKLKTNKAE